MRDRSPYNDATCFSYDTEKHLVAESVEGAVVEQLESERPQFGGRPKRAVPFELVSVRRSLVHPDGGRADEQPASRWEPAAKDAEDRLALRTLEVLQDVEEEDGIPEIGVGFNETLDRRLHHLIV